MGQRVDNCNMSATPTSYRAFPGPTARRRCYCWR